jgi:hypothetical protein
MMKIVFRKLALATGMTRRRFVPTGEERLGSMNVGAACSRVDRKVAEIKAHE